ncbi:MAG: hypothetical protein HY791_23300 [Deltaproteobacteria bacterium]|nr:hypothetical protein [Deltaproteobacteria bacterium]
MAARPAGPNTPPEIQSVSRLFALETKPAVIRFRARDKDRNEVRTFAVEKPAGARWDEAAQTLRFTPDFTQGGRSHRLTLTATDGHARTTETFLIEVADTVITAPPALIDRVTETDHDRLTLRQDGDGFLEEPGRSFEARLVVPHAASPEAPRPLRVFLHGIGGAPYSGGEGDEFRLYPHDPDATYWVGHQSPPNSPSGRLVPFTERRIIALIDWVLRNFAGADEKRVYLVGTSMGGTGALTIGLTYARHVAFVDAELAQTVPRNHRPFRLRQLEALWGPKGTLDDAGIDAWDGRDLSRIIASDPLAREQLIHARFGKDDPTIHFGAMVYESPLTHLSFRDVLATHRMGHRLVWDEGAHGPKDPVLGADWWDPYDPIHDATSSVALDRAFLAFTRSSLDDDPGRGGNGTIPFSPATGFAGRPEVARDTGWDGDVAGQVGAHLRGRVMVDDIDRFEARIWIEPERVRPPLAPKTVACVDVTPRRVQRFQLRPLESVRLQTDGTGLQTDGTALRLRADREGLVTLPRVWVQETGVTITLTREPRDPKVRATGRDVRSDVSNAD